MKVYFQYTNNYKEKNNLSLLYVGRFFVLMMAGVTIKMLTAILANIIISM
jgi:hypothetical protein